MYLSTSVQFYLCVCVCVQEIARGGGGGIADAVNLDVHAIAELQTTVPPTNDKPKYCYTSDDQGNYRESN